MRFRTFGLVTFVAAAILSACTPREPAAPASTSAPASAGQVHGNLAQVMKGILYPNSNVIFSAQDGDPAAVPKAADPATATDPRASVYGGWEAVEDSSLALSEAANLLIIPGRLCSNGRAAPIQNPDWVQFVQGLRDAGMTAYKAAQSKNTDSILEATDAVTTACSNCHDVYREKPGGIPDRCM